MCPLYIAFGGELRYQHTKGSPYQSIYELSEPSQPTMSDDVRDKDKPQHQELCPLLFLKSRVGSLTSHRVICKQGL